ncbi:phosphoenolpyruvate--protein phosphotransferase [Maridesulfovibrio hydrothermalis]|uniref:Phosphoenolpyruvate-protein phosphotransferase n=1 Tax=Maridesulfovibrio hydrothermalis AM13 = DSM 14728 TaxID=1121451 RepID=L0R7S1_9BACT|nr:phosphoenolpyruvate--protein phosphotransferase [Maridesulfovibrio hydrothermalis]CCO22783.1 Phosphoenolpyruvate-protein phosphotransferase [Maridesulfovibrio hydrothermalis AM13 = DSM 14728]
MARAVVNGISVSTGIAIGKAFFLNRSISSRLPRQTVPLHMIENEKERLIKGFTDAVEELAAVREKVPAELKEHQLIIDSHLMMLKDPKFQMSAIKYIDDHSLNAEWALDKAVNEFEKAFGALEDKYIRERMQDVRQVAMRVQVKLIGDEANLRPVEGRIVLMAHDLTPADTIELEVNKLMSFVTTLGGKTSHTGILARTLNIPALVGVAELENSVVDGDLVIIDGIDGKVLVDPSDEELEHYYNLENQFNDYQRTIIRGCQLPAETEDGYRVQVHANIELFEEVSAVIDNGGEGIGLFRTEYAYLNRTDLPTEEELFEKYSDLAAIMSPRKVTLRTLDLGADKFMSHFGSLDEANPALGLRAVRFCLKHPDLFRLQLRAILRASVHGNVSLMFPMICGLREVLQAKSAVVRAQKELREEGIPFDENMPIGVMIELPAAVMIAEILAQEVDFFSIGTNDLIQYSLGIDRTNPHVSYLYQPLHPAVVRSIKYVVDAGHRAGIGVSLCGEVASDPYCVPILMGMQIDSLSLTPQAIPGIKRILRQLNMQECKQLLKEVLNCRTVSSINRLVTENIYKKYPEELTFFASLLDNEEITG